MNPCVLIIPDVHGRTFWREAVENLPFFSSVSAFSCKYAISSACGSEMASESFLHRSSSSAIFILSADDCSECFATCASAAL